MLASKTQKEEGQSRRKGKERRQVEDEGGGSLPLLVALVAWMVLVEAVDEAAAGRMEG